MHAPRPAFRRQPPPHATPTSRFLLCLPPAYPLMYAHTQSNYYAGGVWAFDGGSSKPSTFYFKNVTFARCVGGAVSRLAMIWIEVYHTPREGGPELEATCRAGGQTIIRLTLKINFLRNYADGNYDGGAVAYSGQAPTSTCTFESCEFVDNFAEGSGGS